MTCLKRQAYYEHIMHFSNTKLVKINNDIIAFFTMEFKELKIPVDYDDNTYPVICLKCLAVDRKFQANGIGSTILQYITPQCKELSEFIGCRCLIIDAIREKVNWYKDRGFQFILPIYITLIKSVILVGSFYYIVQGIKVSDISSVCLLVSLLISCKCNHFPSFHLFGLTYRMEDYECFLTVDYSNKF